MLNTFVIQCPKWKMPAAFKGAAAHEDPADLFGEDFDEMYLDQDANIPNVGDHDAARTTASEFDGALDDAEVEDEDRGMEAIESDPAELDEEPKRQKNTKKVCN
jgi:hypothetical protein